MFIPYVNIPWLINQMGGASAIAKAYREHMGMQISIKTVQKWRERSSITLHRLYQLQKLAQAMGIELTPQPGDKFSD